MREFNGLKRDGDVRVHRGTLSPGTNTFEVSEGVVTKVRRVGPAGFYVRGFATFFHWEEEGSKWSRVLKVSR